MSNRSWFSSALTGFVAAALAVTFVSGAGAQVLFSENFSYPAGTALVGQGGWAQTGTVATNPILVTTPTLSYPGYSASGVGEATSLTTSGQDVNNTFASQATGSVYMSAIVNVIATQTNGDYFLHLASTPVSSAFFGRVFARKDPASSSFAFGIQSSSAGVVYTPGFSYLPGTYLVVVKYTFVAGVSNDQVDLFVDPVIGGAEPLPTVSQAGGATDAAAIAAVALRQGTSTSAATVRVDGIRVATSWADLLPAPHTIDASAGTGGSISPSGPVVVGDGATQAFTITADPCFSIADVSVDGSSVGPVTGYTFTNVTTDHTIAATFSANGPYTIAASAGSGGSITPSGNVSVACGADQSFSIAADACYSIAGVVVDGNPVGALSSYTFSNVQTDHTIAATFSLNGPYTIAASAGTGGSITPNGNASVACGADQSFAIAADACYSIADVLVDGSSVGAVASYTFTNVQTDHSIAASFSLNGPYTIAASAGTGGSITPSGNVSVACGADQSFAIAADACYSIANVLVDGSSVGAVSSYTFTNVQANHTIAASFSLNGPYTVMASAGPNGTISPNGAVSVACGSDQTFTITPDAGFGIADVVVDGASLGGVASYTFTNVQANHTIAASFAAATHTITASAGSGGSIAPDGAVAVGDGGNQTFTITPDACYSVADVLVDGSSVGAVTTYSFTNVTADHAIVASFSLTTFFFSATADPGGTISPSGSVAVGCGTDQTFTITPGAGSVILDVLVDGGSMGAISSYTFTNVQAAHAIHATFLAVVVVSQVYGGGGNVGAPFHNDYIELFNLSGTAVDVNGWSVQYASASGATWSTTALSGTIAAGGYYLVQEAAGTGGGAPLPAADATGTIAMNSTAGKVALVNSATALSGTCPSGGSIVDLVGYGSANCAEGSPVGSLSNTAAAVRKSGGCLDTGNNSNDFAIGTPSPRNSLSPLHACQYTLTVTVDPPGSGSVARVPDQTNYQQGTSVELTATQVSGYHFVGWSGDVTGSANPQTVVMDGDKTAVAHFESNALVGIVVISQIYGGGGNTGAPYLNDFIELFNRGNIAVDITGWSLQYASSNGTTWSSHPLSGTIGPGGYFLVHESSGGPNGASLPTADGIGTIAMSANAGKVALVNNGTILVGGCPIGAGVVDFVGYGAANCSEGGAPAPTLDNVTAAFRRGDGCDDSDNNLTDFLLAGPVPRNSSLEPHICPVWTGVEESGNVEFALGKPVPNPTRGMVHIPFALRSEADVRVSVIDLQGRVVATLAGGRFPAGHHEVAWDGRGKGGVVRSGVYFIRMAIPGRSFVQRVAVTQ